MIKPVEISPNFIDCVSEVPPPPLIFLDFRMCFIIETRNYGDFSRLAYKSLLDS